MLNQIVRPASYIAPPLILITLTAGIVFFRPQPKRVAVAELPLWSFSETGLSTGNTVQGRRSKPDPQAGLIHDPFSNWQSDAFSNDSELPGLKLTMAITNVARPCCVINGKLYGLHDQGPDFTVVAIGPAWADVRIDGSVKRLHIEAAK